MVAKFFWIHNFKMFYKNYSERGMLTVNVKKITAIVCTVTLVAAIGVTSVFAATNSNMSWTQIHKGFGQRQQLTDEQKAQMKEKRAEMQAKVKEEKSKWDALTDEQKAEVYDLKDQAAADQTKLIDKYLELGLIDNDQATKMKDAITNRSQQLRESGKMPMMGLGEGNGPGGMRGGMRGGAPNQKPPTEDSATATTDNSTTATE